MGANDSGARFSSKQRQRRTLRRILTMLGCMVAVVTCTALVAPAISMTAQTAQDQAGARLSVQEAEEVAGDGGSQGPSDAEVKSGKGEEPADNAGAVDTAADEGADGSQADEGPESVADDGDAADAALENDADGFSYDEGDGADGASDDEVYGEGDEEAYDESAGGDPADVDVAEGDPASSESAAAQEPDGSQRFAGELKDVTGKVTLSVDVEAPTGALPEGATMRLAPVKRAKVEDAVGGAMAEAAARVAEGTAERASEFVAAEHAGARVQSIQAVDIAFLDADGAEVEPASPITVKLAGPQIKRHVEGEGARSAEGVAEAAGVARDVAARPMLVHVADDGRADMVDVLGKKDLRARDLPAAAKDELVFEAGAFSVYAIVYTVDFHWEVDGASYEFNLEGGSAVALGELLPALGVVAGEEVADFLADVADVQFSAPDLAWVGRAGEPTTFGALKVANGLAPQYSAELTDEQVAEADARPVGEGDWAFISLMPFDTEETLSVTMKDGSVWSIRVTDSRNMGDLDELFSKADGRTQFVLWTESSGVAYALKRDGTTAIIDKNAIDDLGSDFTWTIEYKYNSSDLRYFCIRPSNSDNSSLGLYIRDEFNNPPLVLPGNWEVNVRAKTDGNGGFEIEGWNNTKLVFDTTTKEITSQQGASITPVRIKITEQNKSKFAFRVASDDFLMGYVSGTDVNNVQQTETAEYQSISKDNANKTNNNRITAVARSPKYLFDYWDLNGVRINNGPIIEADTLPIPIDGSVLTAHFRRNPEYEEQDDDEKQGRVIKRELGEWIENLIRQSVPLDDDATKKTAEVYDYENRIYRVDLTSRSNMKSFEGIVDLGFSIDWSGSMNFPSKIKQVTGFKESQYSDNRINELPIGHINDDYWHKTQWLDPTKTYYIITNRTVTADQFRIWYDPNDKEWVQDANGNWHEMGIWKYSMAYYTENEPEHSTKITQNATINYYDGPLTNLQYAIYEDDGNGKHRVDDLRSSVSSTIEHMNSILNQISLAKNTNDNPQVKIAWNDFHWKVPESYKTFQSVTNPNTAIDPQVITEGGTRADLGLEDALGFQWENNSRKYMVLITDGAPQPSTGQRAANQGGWTDEMVQNRTRQFAQELKNQGITLLTIGLSMSDVKVGSVLLYDIASRDNVNEPYFYRADSGDELEYALYEILQTILKDATVIGDVTDTVNVAFYPVDKNTGEPLTPSAEQAFFIDLNGNAMRDNGGNLITAAPENVPYGKIEPYGDTYKVTWTNQEFTSTGWHGTIYEKAKEDFLGGNVVKTNQGEAEVQSKGYIVEGTDKFVEFNDETKAKGHKTFETPRVNVNELNVTENSTEWTVYLGTEVDPETQIKALFDRIEVETVVRSASDTDSDGLPDRIDGANHNYAYTESARDDRQALGEPVKFLLKDLIASLPMEERNKLNWDEIIRLSSLPDQQNTGVTLTYDLYDQDADNAGVINIKLTRDHDPTKHFTETTGSPVETYTLVVEFSPNYDHRPVAVGGDGKYPYHVGDFGLKESGNVAGKDTSTNMHEVNVYVKGFEVTKKDQMFSKKLKGAEFKLYRTVRNGETIDLSAFGMNLHEVAVLDMTAVEKGSVSSVSALREGEHYYLIETKAPAGYNMLADPIPVSLDFVNSYKPVPGGTATSAKPESGPYDWTQSAKLTLDTSSSWVRRTDASGDSELTHTGLAPSAESETMYYDVANDAGAALPMTGGSGVYPVYFLGVALVGCAGIGLAIRRRRTRAAQ